MEVSVATMPMISNLDEQFLAQACNKYAQIFVLEEHCHVGGLYSALSEFYARQSPNIILHPLGLRRVFTDAVGDLQYLRKLFEIDIESITSRIRESICRQ